VATIALRRGHLKLVKRGQTFSKTSSIGPTQRPSDVSGLGTTQGLETKKENVGQKKKPRRQNQDGQQFAGQKRGAKKNAGGLTPKRLKKENRRRKKKRGKRPFPQPRVLHGAW